MVLATVLQSTASVLSQLTSDEIILVLTTIFPVGMGLIAALHALTGDTKSVGGGDDQQHLVESGAIAAISSRTEAALSASTSNMQATVSRVEQQIVDLQRAHDTRFADLHKDLAGIVWELSKLRADMARWQVPWASHAYRTPASFLSLYVLLSRISMHPCVWLAFVCSALQALAQLGSRSTRAGSVAGAPAGTSPRLLAAATTLGSSLPATTSLPPEARLAHTDAALMSEDANGARAWRSAASS